MSRIVKLSVRDFALPVRSKGDLLVGADGGTLNLGVEIHNRIQAKRMRAGGYEKEVFLAGDLSAGGYTFKVSGRADGILTDMHGHIVIEEIKTTGSIERLSRSIQEDDEHPYVLQVKLYCYLYCLKYNKAPDATLLLVSSRNSKEKEVAVNYHHEEFSNWIEAKLEALVRLEEEKKQRKKRRKKVGRSLEFPFANPRQGQTELMATVNETMEAGASALIQAPTGIGKTMGVLFPAIKDALLRGTQVIYVAPKNSQFSVAMEAVKLLRREGVENPKVVMLAAKHKSCLRDEVQCDPDLCRYASNYYDKFHEFEVSGMFKEKDIMPLDYFLESGKTLQMCPYALSHDAVVEADVVVCDYNYVFSPRAALSKIFSDRPAKEKLNLVVDEAHNLYERAMDYFSPRISVRMCDDFVDAIESYPEALRVKCRRFAHRVKEQMCLSFPNDRKPQTVEVDKEEWQALTQDGMFLFMSVMQHENVNTEPMMQFYLGVMNFSDILDDPDVVSSLFYFTDDRNQGLKVKCLDASRFLEKVYQDFHGVVAFSATLKPFEFYRQLSGFGKSTLTKEFTSSFPAENRKVLIIPQVSTTWRDRKKFYDKIGNAIHLIMTQAKGHYMAFFPSYSFMKETLPFIPEEEWTVIVQEPGMTMDEVKEIELAVSSNGNPVLICAVQGGTLAEGVDYRGQSLRGAFIVGPAMPTFDFEREELRRYYDERYEKGFQYAYTYPAMSRSIQAAGRIIRSEDKRGLLVFLDRRFLDEDFSAVMPDGWYTDHVQELVSGSILADVSSFWNS